VEIEDENQYVNPKHVYFLFCCETCRDLILYQSDFPPETFYGDQGLDEEDFFSGLSEYDDVLQQVWPQPTTLLPNVVPQAVRTCYTEALRVRHLAPNAFAGQIRRALEAVCDDLGAERGSLEKRLPQLASSNVIPPVVANIAQLLRKVGNIGAHHDARTVEFVLVDRIDEFFRTMLEYVYIAPNKLRELRKEIESSESQSPEIDNEQVH
jgi:hypothetical protein